MDHADGKWGGSPTIVVTDQEDFTPSLSDIASLRTDWLGNDKWGGHQYEGLKDLQFKWVNKELTIKAGTMDYTGPVTTYVINQSAESGGLPRGPALAEGGLLQGDVGVNAAYKLGKFTYSAQLSTADRFLATGFAGQERLGSMCDKGRGCGMNSRIAVEYGTGEGLSAMLQAARRDNDERMGLKDETRLGAYLGYGWKALGGKLQADAEWFRTDHRMGSARGTNYTALALSYDNLLYGHWGSYSYVQCYNETGIAQNAGCRVGEVLSYRGENFSAGLDVYADAASRQTLHWGVAPSAFLSYKL
jgi:hypothetical protein